MEGSSFSFHLFSQSSISFLLAPLPNRGHRQQSALFKLFKLSAWRHLEAWEHGLQLVWGLLRRG